MPDLKPTLAYLSVLVFCITLAFILNDNAPDIYAGIEPQQADGYDGYTYEEIALLFENSPTCQEAAASGNEQGRNDPEIIALLAACQDLWQQTRMADSTESMERANWVQVGIGVIGILLLIGTLNYTAQAAESTNQTLRIAQGTLNIGRESSIAELRAYMSVIPEPEVHWDEEEKEIVAISMTFKNVGNTYAKEVQVCTRSHCYTAKQWYERSIKNWPDSLDFKKLHESEEMQIPPGGQPGSIISISDFSRRFMEHSNEFLVFDMIIEYSDVFDNRYILLNRWRMEGYGLKQIIWSRPAENNMEEKIASGLKMGV